MHIVLLGISLAVLDLFEKDKKAHYFVVVVVDIVVVEILLWVLTTLTA